MKLCDFFRDKMSKLKDMSGKPVRAWWSDDDKEDDAITISDDDEEEDDALTISDDEEEEDDLSDG